MEPATVPLVADRWTPFSHTIEYQGEDLTGANFGMHVRLTYDAPGSPLAAISLGSGITLDYAGTTTVASHIAAERISEVPEGMTASDTLPLSIISLYFAEGPISAMPFPAERGNDAVLYYDIIVTPAGGDRKVMFRGTFTIRAGATQ